MTTFKPRGLSTIYASKLNVLCTLTDSFGHVTLVVEKQDRLGFKRIVKIQTKRGSIL